MRRVSVSEVIRYESCRREWRYKYVDRLGLREPLRGGPLASGSAVHYVVEHVCERGEQKVPSAADVRALALESLRDDFRNSGSPDKQVQKFLPGVLRAVAKIPDEIWTSQWQVEQDLELELGYLRGTERVDLIGRPDLFRIQTTDEGQIVELIDIKTTKTDPLVYMLWEPQITWYALMLQGMYPEALIKYRYLCVPTQGENPAPQAPTWVFKREQLRRAHDEVVRLVGEMNPEHTEMRRSRKCDWCDFRSICTAEITGADIEGVKQELFTVRPTEQERMEKEYDTGI